MKQIRRYMVPGLCAGLLLASGLILVFNTTHNDTRVTTLTWEPLEQPAFAEIPREEKSPTNPGEAFQLRILQTQDPATKTVPTERLWAANRAAELSGRTGQGLLAPFTERGPDNIGGRTRAVLWDPDVTNKVWAAGVSGGLWFTADITVDGTPWIKVDDFWDNLAVSSMAFDPMTTGDNRTYYVGTGEGFFNADAVRGNGITKSTDGGNTWNFLPSTENNSSFHYVQKIVVTGTGTVLAATQNGIQRSTNGGTSWTKVLGGGVGSPSSGLTNFAADLEIAANGDIYAGMGLIFSGSCDGVYQSTNDGVNWTKMALPGACDYRRVEVATAPSDANTVYVATQDETTRDVNHIFKTTDGGTNWASPGAAPGAGTQAWYDLIIAVDPNDAETAYLGVVTLWRTTNGGANWSQVGIGAIHVDHHAIAYKPGSSTEIAFGNDGGVYYTSTATSKQGAVPTFIDRNDDFNVTQYYGGDIHPTSGSAVMIGGTQDNSTHRFSTAGIGSVTSPSPLNCCDGGFAFIDQTNSNIMVGSIQNGAYFRSTNGGVSFSGVPFLNAGGLFINPGDYDDVRNVFYATRTTTSISACFQMETTPTCFVLSGITGMNGMASSFAVSPYSAAGTSVVYFGTQNGELFRVLTTLDGSGLPTGASTSQINPALGSTENVSSIAIGSTEQQLLITLSNYGINSVWETQNGGTTWLDRDDNLTLPDMPINGALYDPADTDRVLLATEAGVWGTDDLTAGPVWIRELFIPIVRVDQLQYRASDGEVMVVTHGRGVYTGEFPTLLPVELTRFDAVADGPAVRLTWETASETNNAGFEIQRLSKNETDASWVASGFVEGHGTTPEPRSYQHSVEALMPGRYVFRLKQLDYDGTFEYSPEVEVAVDLPESYALSPAYPNPFNPETQFSLAVAVKQHVRVEVYDVAGRRIAMLHDAELEADQPHRFTFDARDLPSGTYFYQVIGERFRDVKTMTLVK